MSSLEANGITLCYARKGTGAPLLVIGGSHADLRKSPNVLDTPLSDAFAALTYDQRGLGRSGKPDGPYAMTDYASDAACMIDALCSGSAHVIGISFGGMVAQELAIRHPQRVRGLVLCCSSPGGSGGASYPIHTLKSLSAEQRARHMIPIWDCRHDAAWAATHPEEFAALLRAVTHDPFAAEAGLSKGRALQLAARAQHDTWTRLTQITAPTLVCGGLYDRVAPPETQKRIASQIPNAGLELFEGGHLFMHDDARAYSVMVKFLRGCA